MDNLNHGNKHSLQQDSLIEDSTVTAAGTQKIDQSLLQSSQRPKLGHTKVDSHDELNNMSLLMQPSKISDAKSPVSKKTFPEPKNTTSESSPFSPYRPNPKNYGQAEGSGV